LFPARLIDLGLADFHETWQQQRDLVGKRQRGEVPDTILLVEHPHVITIGRSQRAKANVLFPGDVPVIEIERGGDATYHGPGQLVAYPILLLREDEHDLHRFLRNLEEAMIRCLGDFEIEAGRRAGATGVWVGARLERKIASIGISCRRWVTFHGLALNVSTDLSYFQRINPCGLESSVMTSMAQVAVGPSDMARVRLSLPRHLADCLHRTID